MRCSWILAVSCVNCMLSQEVFALTPPPAGNAGIIDKQIQRDYDVETTSPTKEIPLLEVDIPEKMLSIPDGGSVLVKHVHFQGNTVLSEKQLQEVIKPYIDKPVTSDVLKALCSSVQKLYAHKGYILARAFPPVQEIHGHTLVIQIMEGCLGQVEVQGNKYYSARYIKKHFKSQMKKAVNYNEIVRSLLLLNENMDLSVGAIFRKGKELGEADLIVIVKDKLPLHVYADYNNYGSQITTNDRLGGRLDAGNLLTSGDKLSFTEVLGFPPDHLNFSNAVYSVPLNGNGMRLDLSYLYSHFEVGRLRVLDLSGLSNIAGFRVHQALKRTRRFSTDLFVGFDYKQIKNEQMGSAYSYDKLRVVLLGGKLDYIDSFKGRNICDIYFSAGIPDFLGGLKAIDSQCSRQGAGGRFFIGNLDLKRLQQLPLDCLLIFSVSGQGTINRIPISEQVYIGGVDTVRGYPLAAAIGDNGYYGTLELRVPPPFLRNKKLPFSKHKKWKDFIQFVGFADTGAVFLNKHVPAEDPSYLTSAGVGVRIYGPWRFDISFDSGFPLTSDHKSSDSIQYVKVGLKIL